MLCNLGGVAHSKSPAIPRLTFSDYLIRRQFLRQQWWEAHDGAAFADLLYQQQLDLHDYFAPAAPFTNQEALAHRREMTIAFPSLPQKAGRAFMPLRAAEDGTPNQIVDTYRDATTSVELIASKSRSVRISGTTHPTVDYYRLARALLNLERHDVDGKLLAKAKKLRERRSH
jgi:hypothetical protein